MKWIIMLAGAFILSITATNAQKLLSTKSGKVSFFSGTPLEDIEATNSEVESKLLPSNGQLVFSLLVKGFQFENQLMEDHFNENYMESAKFPKAAFKGFIANIAGINFKKEGSYAAKTTGDLTIHGITKKVQANGTVIVKGGKITAQSKFNIKLKDYGIGGDLIGNKIADNISISVDCRYQ